MALADQLLRYWRVFSDVSWELVASHTHISDGLVAGVVLSADGLGIADDKLYRNSVNASLYMGYAPRRRK